MEAKLYLTNKNYDKLERVVGKTENLKLIITEEYEKHIDCVLVFDKVDEVIIQIIDVLK